MAMPDPNIIMMVVDDFATMRRIIKNLLRQLGYENIIEADDGTTALQKLQEGKVGLIVSDWNMPKMTGLDMVKAIRADNDLKDIPILMVTAEAKKENILNAMQAGVNNYIVKPFTAKTLQEKLETMF